MIKTEFDQIAGSYTNLLEKSISMSGEKPEYFADYKMKDFRQLIGALGFPENGRYLDFGSGVGSSIKPFFRCLPSARLVCADVSAESLLLSKNTHGEVADYVCIENGMLPFGDSEFDGAFACCVFHHIAGEHVPALKEIRRVLKPQGLFMIYELNPFNPLTVHAFRNSPLDANAVLKTSNVMLSDSLKAGFAHYSTDYRVFFPGILAWFRPLEDYLRRLPLGAQYFIALRS